MSALPEHLTEEQRVGAALLIMFAVLNYDEARDGWWYMHAVNRSHSPDETDLAGCVWWSIRMQGEDGCSSTPEEHMQYIEHVCRNRRVLRR